MDFIAQILAKLDARQAEADLNSLVNKKYEIDIGINLENKNLNITKFSNNIESSFNKTGENAGKNFTSALQRQIETQARTQRNAFSQPLNNMTKSQKSYSDWWNKELSKQEKQIKSFTQLDTTTASNKTLSWLKNNSKAAKDYGDVLTDLANKQRLATNADELKDYTKQVNAIKSEAIALGKTGRSFTNEVENSFKRIGQFVYTYGLIQQIPNTIGKMITAVKDVDAAKIELKKVTTASNNELSSYWDEAAESAKKYGATISDVISSTADWSRLGYNLKDAKELSDATTLLQKVGDNMTQSSSSQGIISTIKGFEMQADEVNKIVDVVNQVANTQPIDTSGLFEGLERSASSMNAANNTFEQTVSLITAANSVVQDPSSVGTALKTISMRVRGASTELLEAGLDADGMAESVAKLREEVKALSGVDIMINDNTFKSTYEILDELSVKWKDLTDIQQASVTELIAGKRNGNIVSSLMSNFQIARDSLNTALNDSTGSAERELENWNKGIEASLSRFKAQFQELSTTTFDSGLLKGIVDTGTDAIGILESLIDNFGILQTVISGIALGKGAFTFVESFDKPAYIAS